MPTPTANTATVYYLDNPPRRRGRKRRGSRKGKMPAGLARYHAARKAAKHRRRRHRSNPSGSKPRVIHAFINSKGTTMKHRRRTHRAFRRRRFRHNPPGLGGITSGIGGKLAAVGYGVAGIAATNIATNAIVGAMKLDATTSAQYKPWIKGAVALLGLPYLAKLTRMPGIGQAAIVAASAALADYLKTVPTLGTYLSGDGASAGEYVTVPGAQAVMLPALPPPRFT